MIGFSRNAMRVAAFVYALALIVLSVLPSGKGVLGGWDQDIAPSLQNTLHVPVYALLAVLVTFAMPPRLGNSRGRLLLVALCCCVFGLILEFAQVFVPGRSASVIDALLNVVGVGVGVLIVFPWRRKAGGNAVPSTSSKPTHAGGRQKCREMVRRHYHDRGWCSPNRRYENLLAELINESSVVLDVGCGRIFPLAAYLLQCGADVHGIDPMVVPEAIPPGVTVKHGTAEHIPYPDDTFDVLTSRSVLEHLKRPVAAFREFHRVLKPGGVLVFVTPSKYDYVSLIARIVPNSLHARMIGLLEGREEASTFPTYYRANSARQISQIAARTGFGVEKLEYVNHYPYLLTFSPLLCRVVIAYDELIQRWAFLRWLQGGLLGIVRNKKAKPFERATQ